MNQDELRSAQEEIFDVLVPVLLIGTLVIGWLAVVLPVPVQVADAQTRSALIGRWIATTGAVLFVGGLTWLMRKRGHFRAATKVLVAGLTVLITAALMLWPDAPGSAILYLYPLVVITAGFLIRPVAALHMVILIMLAMLAALLASGGFTLGGIAQLLPTLLLTSLTAAITWLSARHLMAVLRQAAQSEAWGRQQAQILQAGRQQFERAVAYLQANRAQLAETRRALEEAKSAATQLVTNLSRDFRPSLNVIVNFAYILADGRRGPVTDEQRNYLHRTYDAGEHLLRTLNDLADLAKVEAGEIELNCQPVDLARLGEEAIQSTAAVLADRRLELHNAIPCDLPQPIADESRIRQVLRNLLENAIQHDGQGQVTLSAKAENGEVVVSVSDTRAGIQLEDLEQVFEPFAYPASTPVHPRFASRLSLPISRRLVELHGGQVWVESHTGAGSTFYFTLPLQPSPAPLADEEETNSEMPDFETVLLSLRAGEEDSEFPPHIGFHSGQGGRIVSTVRERFIAIGLVGLCSILALVVIGMALGTQVDEEDALSQHQAIITTMVRTDATPTPIPLAVVKSPRPSPTPSPMPTATGAAEAISGTVEPPTPTATTLPESAPTPSATPRRPTDTPPPPTPSLTAAPSPTVTPSPTITLSPSPTPQRQPTGISDVEVASSRPRVVFTSERGGQFDVYVMPVDGDGPARLIADLVDVRSPTVSPDGKRILFCSEQDGNRDLYVVNADGSSLIRLTNDPAHDESPAWSPDGNRIAFASYRRGNYDIYVAKADGSDLARVTTSLAWDQSPAWSPDGQRIAFISDQTGYYEIYVISSDGNELTQLTDSGADHGPPTWAPDGTRLAFHMTDDASTSGTGPRRSIFVMDADGGRLTRLTDATADDADPVWTPDGRILFTSNRGGNYDLYLMASDGSGLTRLTDTPFDELEPTWSPGF